MIPVYLIENHIGAFSSKVYGLKGDKVFILTHTLNMRLVIDASHNKFWVNINNLSDAPIQKNIIKNEDIKNIKNIKSRKKTK